MTFRSSLFKYFPVEYGITKVLYKDGTGAFAVSKLQASGLLSSSGTVTILLSKIQKKPRDEDTR
jgi:hypothetical protein